MSEPTTLAGAVSLLISRRKKLRRNIPALVSLINRHEVSEKVDSTLTRDTTIVALEKQYKGAAIALVRQLGTKIVTDAELWSTIIAMDDFTFIARANQLVREATTAEDRDLRQEAASSLIALLFAVEKSRQTAGIKQFNEVAFAKDDEVVSTTSKQLWIQKYNGGSLVDKAGVLAAMQ